MQSIKIVVWDNIGNTLLGVRPWESWSSDVKTWLLAEDAAGAAHAPSFAELFAEYDVNLEWYQSNPTGPGIFGALQADFAPAVRQLTDVARIVETVADADFVVIHKERLPAEAVEGATRLRLLQHLGHDYRGVPMAAARAKGIPVAATPLVNYIAVAEHVWAFILNHLKQLPVLRARMQERPSAERWGKAPRLQLARDLTLGLVGFGEIARPIARIAQAFDMPTIYWDIERFPELEERYGVTYVEWDDLFSHADVLSVQLALNAQTEGIIGAREIRLMKPDALFINTARGKLVDQGALITALQEKRIGGAALDVFYEEPLPVDDPLHDLHERLDASVTITPHLAWQSPWTWVRDSQELWYNVLRSLRDEPIHYLV